MCQLVVILEEVELVFTFFLWVLVLVLANGLFHGPIFVLAPPKGCWFRSRLQELEPFVCDTPK